MRLPLLGILALSVPLALADSTATAGLGVPLAPFTTSMNVGLAMADPDTDVAPNCPGQIWEAWGALIDTVVVAACRGELADRTSVARLLESVVTWEASELVDSTYGRLVQEFAHGTESYQTANKQLLTYQVIYEHPRDGVYYTRNRAVFVINFDERHACLAFDQVVGRLEELFLKNNDRLDTRGVTYIMNKQGGVKTVVGVRPSFEDRKCLWTLDLVEYEFE